MPSAVVRKRISTLPFAFRRTPDVASWPPGSSGRDALTPAIDILDTLDALDGAGRLPHLHCDANGRGLADSKTRNQERGISWQLNIAPYCVAPFRLLPVPWRIDRGCQRPGADHSTFSLTDGSASDRGRPSDEISSIETPSSRIAGASCGVLSMALNVRDSQGRLLPLAERKILKLLSFTPEG